MERQQLIFIYTARSSFVKRDIDILAGQYTVTEFCFSQKKKMLLPFTFLRQFFFLISRIRKAKAIIIQFGGYHSFLPVWMSRFSECKSVVIAGGVDCNYYPEIRYGYMGKNPIRYFTAYSFKHSNLILPKHESLIYFKDTYNYEQPAEQGIRHFIPEFRTPYAVVYNGFDGRSFYKMGSKDKNTFMTAAFGLDNETNIRLKGIDLILQVAVAFPQCIFTIVGGTSLKDSSAVPANVILKPAMGHHELLAAYSEHEYYLQLSMSEGFPNAVCEAMLCECIPIGSAVNSIPEIIGETGYVLRKRNTGELKKLIQQALQETKSGAACRSRILNEFSLQKRHDSLLHEMSKLLSS